MMPFYFFMYWLWYNW